MTGFSSKIKEAIKIIGKEEQIIAKELGISKARLSHYKSGRNKVPSEILERFINFYKIPAAFFLTDNFVWDQQAIESNHYPFYPDIESLANIKEPPGPEAESIEVPEDFIGKHVGAKDIFFTRIKDDSMNKPIPRDSLIGIIPVPLPVLKDQDFVAFSNDDKTYVRRFFNDKVNQRFVFKPESTNIYHTDFAVKYSDLKTIRIHGKVVIVMGLSEE